jgi:hypothetical protein
MMMSPLPGLLVYCVWYLGQHISICHAVPWYISNDDEPAAIHKAQGLKKSLDTDFLGLLTF